MNISRIKNGDLLTVKLSGNIDTTTAPQLDAGVRSYLDGITELILDFGEVGYITSAGLRILLIFQEIMNKQGTMKLTGVNDTACAVFEVTGFNEILTYEKGETE